MIIATFQETERRDPGEFTFVGGLLRDHVWPNIGIVAGGLIGGPVGALAGGLIQTAVNSCLRQDRIAASRGTSTTSSTSPELTLSTSEGNALKSWIDTQLTPTAQAFINKIDSKSGTINQSLINESNKILKEIAVLKAYSTTIKTFGEMGPGGTPRSQNYVLNKTEVLNKFIVIAEKSILQFLETNATEYKVVLESFRASSTT